MVLAGWCAMRWWLGAELYVVKEKVVEGLGRKRGRGWVEEWGVLRRAGRLHGYVEVGLGW